MTDDYHRLMHAECLIYDQGQRDALRQHLRMLRQLAEKQADRSGQTARHRLAGDCDRKLHAADVKLADAIEALACDGRGVK